MNVLVIEDDVRMNRIICDYLKQENFNTFSATDGESGIEIFNETSIDLVLLDVMIPKLDGFSVCKRIRMKSDVIIVIISARADETDKLIGYEFGADDYITKPFSPKVLVARVKAIYNRFNKDNTHQLLEKGILKINKDYCDVHVNGDPVNLTAKEFDLLVKLAQNEKFVFSRNQLINDIWSYDYLGDGRIVDTNIKTLRKKLGLASVYIKTVVGKGYKFEL